jgi:hypothetical protein
MIHLLPRRTLRGLEPLTACTCGTRIVRRAVTKFWISRQQVRSIPITTSVMDLVHALAKKDHMPQGLKLATKTGTVLYDSTMIAGVDYVPPDVQNDTRRTKRRTNVQVNQDEKDRDADTDEDTDDETYTDDSEDSDDDGDYSSTGVVHQHNPQAMQNKQQKTSKKTAPKRRTIKMKSKKIKTSSKKEQLTLRKKCTTTRTP